MSATDHYTIISSDTHAGGSHEQYRGYLEARYLDEFDAWRNRYKNPFRDLQAAGRERNWDDEQRATEEFADGIVGEVIFPNTVPPFFPTGQVIAPAPTAADFELRLVGLRVHNRWLADFCAARPNQRAGLAQIFLNDIDEAIADVRWAKDHGLAGILLPGVAPNTEIEPLFSPAYDRLWAVCQDLELPITNHSGGTGIPDFGRYPATTLMFAMETAFFANRTLWHMVLSGVFERFPRLVLVMTEQGSAWVPETLMRMDGLHAQMAAGRIGELRAADVSLPMKPSEYFQRNCFVGASFPTPREAASFTRIGLDRVMWGSDYPHDEGTPPYSREALRRSFSSWAEDDMRKILGATAARVYGFDLDALAPLAAIHGPTVAELAVPLDQKPPGARSMAFM